VVRILHLRIDAQMPIKCCQHILGCFGLSAGSAPCASDAPTTRPPRIPPPATAALKTFGNDRVPRWCLLWCPANSPGNNHRRRKQTALIKSSINALLGPIPSRQKSVPHRVEALHMGVHQRRSTVTRRTPASTSRRARSNRCSGGHATAIRRRRVEFGRNISFSQRARLGVHNRTLHGLLAVTRFQALLVEAVGRFQLSAVSSTSRRRLSKHSSAIAGRRAVARTPAGNERFGT